MAPKLFLIRTGDYIVSEAREARGGDLTILFYALIKPKLIRITGEYALDGGKQNTSISLFSWPPFTKEEQITLTPDNVVTIAEPTTELIELYNESTRNTTTNTDLPERSETDLPDPGEGS